MEKGRRRKRLGSGRAPREGAGERELDLAIGANLARAVRRLGGSEADVRRLASPVGRRTLVEMARLAVAPATPGFPVTVAYDRPLEESIRAGAYDWVDPEITVRHFPMLGTGARELAVELVQLELPATTAEVLAYLAERGLEPALLEELLALGERYPEPQREHPIVALGSIWRRARDLQAVVYLHGHAARRSLALHWIDDPWQGPWRFAAARR